MGKGMAKWWDRKWRLVIVATLLPILLVPIISVFLFPEKPLTESLLYGAVSSLFVLLAFRILQHIEWWGLRVVILVVVVGALLGLLLGFVASRVHACKLFTFGVMLSLQSTKIKFEDNSNLKCST